MNFIRRYTFPGLIALSALSVSASAAFYSVSGLGKMFEKIFQESVQDDLNSLRKKIENGLISASYQMI